MTFVRPIAPAMTALLLCALAGSCGLSVGPEEHPLLDATLNIDVKTVQELLDDGADPNKGNDDSTPIMGAAEVGSVEIVTVLLRAGADPKRKTEDDDTPLTILATNNDNVAAAELLLEAGVDPCARPTRPSRAKPAQQLAEEVGHHSVANYLASKTACPE